MVISLIKKVILKSSYYKYYSHYFYYNNAVKQQNSKKTVIKKKNFKKILKELIKLNLMNINHQKLELIPNSNSSRITFNKISNNSFYHNIRNTIKKEIFTRNKIQKDDCCYSNTYILFMSKSNFIHLFNYIIDHKKSTEIKGCAIQVNQNIFCIIQENKFYLLKIIKKYILSTYLKRNKNIQKIYYYITKTKSCCFKKFYYLYR